MMDKVKQICTDSRLCILSVLLGMVFAATIVVGDVMASYDTLRQVTVPVVFKGILLFPCMVFFAGIVISCYDRYMKRMRGGKSELILRRFTNGDWRYFFVLWALLFLAWTPVLLSAFPGIYDIDGAFQVMWFQQGNISAHHPVLHTYILGGCVTLGKTLFGSYEAGILCYSLLQMVCLSGMFAYLCKSTCKWLPAIIQVVVMLSFLFLPYHAVLSITTTKDVLFAGVFAIWILKTYECVIEKDLFFHSAGRQLRYVGLVVLMCCLRNTGYYILLFMCPFFLLVCRKYWKSVFCIVMASVLIWNLWAGPLCAALGIRKGSEAEMLSVPMQQLSRVMMTEDAKLDEADKDLIKRYIPNYDRYTSRVSDSVKDTFNTAAYMEDRQAFFKLWFRVGMDNPRLYVEAFLSNNIGFWYPSMHYPDPGAYLSYIVYNNTTAEGDWPVIQRTSYLPTLSGIYEKLTETGSYYSIPGAYLFYSGGVLFWMLLICIAICLYKRRYEMFLPLSLCVGLWGTLMLSPVVVFRYMYPLIASLPVLLCIASEKKSCISKNIC